MDIITVMLILLFSVVVGALVALLIGYIMERKRARRAQLQPLIGVVLPKEDEGA